MQMNLERAKETLVTTLYVFNDVLISWPRFLIAMTRHYLKALNACGKD